MTPLAVHAHVSGKPTLWLSNPSASQAVGIAGVVVSAHDARVLGRARSDHGALLWSHLTLLDEILMK